LIKRLWRYLKLLRKAFLTNPRRRCYSQFGEDIILDELIKTGKRTGFFVDIGCYHPTKHSNSYALYKRGWRGVNIDVETRKIQAFNLVRPKDCNVLSAVSDKKESVVLYRYSDYGVGSTISDEYAETVSDNLMDTTILETKTLMEILDSSPYKDRQIDVISVDVEGMDFRVIKSLNFDIYQPKIVIVEDHHRTLEEIFRTEMYQLLKSKGYSLRSWTFYSLIFILPGADLLKHREKI